MNERERRLVKILGVFMAFGAVPLSAWWFWGTLQEKDKEIEKAGKQVTLLKLLGTTAARSQHYREGLRSISLPADPNVAEREYKKWLMGLGQKHFETPEVSADRSAKIAPKKTEIAQVTRYTLKVQKGRLEKLLNFLADFYAYPCVHRITSLKIIPDRTGENANKPASTFAFTISIDAMAVAGAEDSIDMSARTLADVEPDVFSTDLKVLAEFKDAIAKRNIFGAPNTPPEISKIGERRIYSDEKLNLAISARDPDETDELQFKLTDSNMSDVVLEQKPGARSATLTGPTLGVGEYKFVVMVADSGLPSKTAQEEFKIVVEDRPPPPPRNDPPPRVTPKFDPAVATYISAIVGDKDGVTRVWIDVKPTGQLLKLAVGDSFEVGTVKGTVKEIRRRSVILDVNNEPWELFLSDRLKSND